MPSTIGGAVSDHKGRGEASPTRATIGGRELGSIGLRC